MNINIVEDFTECTGGRYKRNGEYSGEEFRETILLPKYKEAYNKNEKLIVDLDGGFGYGTSFLEEAFGGLVRSINLKEAKKIKELLVIKCEDAPRYIEKINNYINAALKEKKV